MPSTPALSQPSLSSVAFDQVDWFGSQAPVVSFSEWGKFSVTITPDTQVEYINVLANTGGSDVWIVKNLPSLPSGVDPTTQRFSTLFDFGLLGVTRGFDLLTLDYLITIDAVPRTSAPGAGSMTSISVGSVVRDAEGKGTGPFKNPGAPADLTSLNFTFLFLEFNWEFNIPNVDLDSSTYPDDLNGCGPAAAANSLKWLGAPGDVGTIFEDISDDMGRVGGDGVDDDEFLDGKLKYINDEGLNINVKFMDDSLGGSDYTTGDECETDAQCTAPSECLASSGHWVTVAGSIDLGLVQGIWTKDDGDQENAGGTETTFSWLRTRADGYLEATGYGRNKVDIVVSESPIDPVLPALQWAALAALVGLMSAAAIGPLRRNA